MTLIPWSDDYALHIEEIDNQHKQLIEIINRLSDSFKQGMSDQILGQSLMEMVAYAKSHFVTEENLMAQYNYPNMHKQKLMHEYFVARTRVFAEGFMKGEKSTGTLLLSFLQLWLVDHILQEDKEIAKFINSNTTAANLA